MEPKDIPTLPAYTLPCGCCCVVFCPFCERPHSHSRGGGHRVSHCWKLDSPWKATGYEIVEAGPLTQEVEASIRLCWKAS